MISLGDNKIAKTQFQIWLSTCESNCFQHVLAIAILSVRLFVCPSDRLSVTRVDQSKAVQARITKFSPRLPGKL